MFQLCELSNLTEILKKICPKLQLHTGWAIWTNGWFGLTSILVILSSAWFCLGFDQKLAELSEQVGKLFEYHRPNQMDHPVLALDSKVGSELFLPLWLMCETEG